MTTLCECGQQRAKTLRQAWAVEQAQTEPILGLDDLEEWTARVVVDVYPFNEKAVETAEYARPGTKTAQQPEISLPARRPRPGRAASPIRAGGSSLTAGGPGSTTFRLAKSQLVAANRPLEPGPLDGLAAAVAGGSHRGRRPGPYAGAKRVRGFRHVEGDARPQWAESKCLFGEPDLRSRTISE